MSQKQSENSPDDQHFEKRIDYLKMRIDQTLTHLQVASKQIYLVDGAVLAFAYFVVNAFGLTKLIAIFIGALAVVLSCLNYLHSQFIMTQSHWYRENDKRIRKLLNEPDTPSLPQRKFTKNLFTSSHRNIANIHRLIAFSLFIMAIVLFVYAFSNFKEIPMKSGNGLGSTESSFERWKDDWRTRKSQN